MAQHERSVDDVDPALHRSVFVKAFIIPVAFFVLMSTMDITLRRKKTVLTSLGDHKEKQGRHMGE